MNGFMKRSIAVASVFIWVGFVCAISFMEAWLKFRAPGVSLGIGLGIGRLVFGALNKVEWVLFLASAVCLFPWKAEKRSVQALLLVLAVLLLGQTFWMLPALDARAELHIAGAAVPPSNMHFCYVAAEGAKVVALVWTGIRLIPPRGNPAGRHLEV